MKQAALSCVLMVCTAWASIPLAAETILKVSVTPGKNWETTSWIGLFPMKHTPQIAVWIEDASGKFVKTITISEKSGKNKWLGAPANGRPEALPVWQHKAQSSKNNIDAMSSATPKKNVEFQKNGDDLTEGAEYVVFFEVNTSFDYNDSWPKNAKKGEVNWSGVNGQPSIVYSAHFVVGQDTLVTLSPIGTGSIDGSDGLIRPGLAGITTALALIDSVTFSIK